MRTSEEVKADTETVKKTLSKTLPKGKGEICETTGLAPQYVSMALKELGAVKHGDKRGAKYTLN